MSAICQLKNSCVSPQTQTSEALSIRAARLAVCLEQSVHDFIVAGDQNLGHIELEVEQQSRELLRAATEKAAPT